MKTALNSKLILLIQFCCILILLFNDASIFDNAWALLFSVLGAAVGFWALIHNDFYNFNITRKQKEHGQLIKDGPYKYSRHPMHLALLLIMLGVTISVHETFDYFVYLILFIVLYYKALKEEHQWSLRSSEYKEYQEKTKMFIPFVF